MAASVPSQPSEAVSHVSVGRIERSHGRADADFPATEGLNQRIGRRIRQVRHERGLSLSQLGSTQLLRGFLSAVESGRSSVSLQSLAFIASRLKLPMSYFLDEAPLLEDGAASISVNQAEAALGYSLYLRSLGKTEEALEYALWAAQAKLGGLPGQPP